MGDWWNPFDDANGAFQGGSDSGTSPAGPGHHSVRGTPQAGTPVNQANFGINYNGGGTAVTQNAQGIQDSAGNVSNALIGTGQQAGANVAGAGAQLGMMGQGYANQGNSPGNALQQGNYGQANAAISQARQNQAAQGGYAAQLAGAGGQDTLSAANATLNQGTNNALNSAMSIAKSGQGFGGSAASLAQAAQAAPGVIANQANQAAILAANESQAKAQREMAGYQGAGAMLNAANAQQLQGAGLQSQQEQQNALLRQQGLEANTQRQLGLGQLGLGYNQAALQGIQAGNQLGQQSMQNAAQLGLESQLQAGQLGLGGQQLDLQAAQLAQQGNISYEQALNELYGMDIGSQIQNRGMDQQSSRDWVSGVTGTIGAIGSVAAMSDRRTKTNVQLTNLRKRYAALGGGNV